MTKKKEAVETEMELQSEKVVQQPSTEAVGCKHHFGYLSERSKSEALPEECIVCPKIVQCMLKSVSE
ncbi:MAG: hypothetical protein C0193_00315 [Candidatus Bathyarchaeota archaeon]|nr:MAG: hypothetical protein C0193_00315 [Candidatus Bathyarchaeota archaeon]